MFTYCLFCAAGKSGYVALAVRALFGCRAIVPKQIQYVWGKQQKRMINRVRDLFPGYVFLYGEEELDIPRIQRIDNVIRCLHSGTESYELTGSDEAFALFMLEKEGYLGKTLVCENRETGRLYLPPKIFRGADVSILKVIRRNHKMEIAIRLLKETVHTWVEYEVVPEEALQEPFQEAPLDSGDRVEAVNGQSADEKIEIAEAPETSAESKNFF